MDPMEFFFLDEFVFQGLEDSRRADCPHCGVSLEVSVDADDMKRECSCENCGGRFQLQ